MRHANRNRRHHQSARTLILGLAVIGIWEQSALGATRTWDRDGGNNNWSTGANWSANTVPGSLDSVVFPSIAPIGTGSIVVPANAMIQTLTFNNSYTLTSGTLEFVFSSQISGNITTTSGTSTIASQLTGTCKFTKLGASTLVLSNASNDFTGLISIEDGTLRVSSNANLGNTANSITLNDAILSTTAGFSTSRAFTIGVAGGTINTTAGTFTVNSSIAQAGAGAVLTKTGAGTLSLGAANHFDGMNIDGGTVQISADNRLGDNNTINMNGGTLATTATIATNRQFVLGASGGGLNIAPSTTLTFNGGLSGSGGLTKSGDGHLVLSNTSRSYSGGTTITGGILTVTTPTSPLGGGTIAIDGGTLRYAGLGSWNPTQVVSVGPAGATFANDSVSALMGITSPIIGNGPVTIAGTGYHRLAASSTFVGGVTVNSGILEVTHTDTMFGDPSNTLTVDSGHISVLTFLSTSRQVIIGAGGMSVDGHDGITASFSGTVSGNGPVHFNTTGSPSISAFLTASNTFVGDIDATRTTIHVNSDAGLGDAGNSLTLLGSGLFITGTWSTSRSIVLGPGSVGGNRIGIPTDQMLTLNSPLLTTGNTTEPLTVQNIGTLWLTAASGRTGVTNVSNASMRLSNASGAGSGPINVTGSDGILELDGVSCPAVTLGALTLLRGTGSASFTGASGKAITVASSATVSIATGTSSADLFTLTGGAFPAIAGGSGSTIRVGGTGTVALLASNSFAGNWSLESGTLAVNTGAALGTGSSLTISGATLKATGPLAVSHNITLAVPVGSVDTNGNSVTFSGNITGPGPLVKDGAGTLSLTGSNSYASTTIHAGVLQIGAGSTGSIDGPVSNSGELVFNRSGSITFASQITGSGSVSTLGSGTVTFTGSHTYAGITTISAGTLQIGNGGATGSVSGAINNNANLIFNRAGLLSISAAITGSGQVTQQGTGTVVLSGMTRSSSYTGGTTINGGRLEMNVIPSTTSVHIVGGSLAVGASDADGAGPGVQGSANAVSRIVRMTIGASGKLDLTNNALVIPATGTLGGSTISVDSLRAALIAGRGGVGTGAATWDGAGGIVTSSFNFDETAGSLGYIWNGDPNLLPGTIDSVNGFNVTDSDYIVKFTSGADSNLDGLVEDTDVAVIGLTYDNGATTGHHWYEGDYNYDGKVSDDDIAILGLSYAPGAAALSPLYYAPLAEQVQSGVSGGVANVVPEPGLLGVLGLLGWFGVGRRRVSFTAR